MPSRRKLLIIVPSSNPATIAILAIFLVCPIVGFSVDWQPIDPAELQMKDLPQQPGAAACVLYRDEYTDDQQGVITVYKRIKVLTEAGRKYADVQIAYEKFDYDVTDLHARTIHPDGTVAEFHGKPLDRDIVKSKSVRLKAKTFSLPDVQVGSVLEYKYNVTIIRGLVIPHWVLQEEIFERKEHFRFRSAAEVLDSPTIAGHAFGYSSNLPEGTKVISPSAFLFDLEASNIPAFVEEEHMPPPTHLKYQVRFYYYNLGGVKYDYASHKLEFKEYWVEQGQLWSKDEEHFLGKNGGVAQTVSSIISPSDTPEQKVRKIYAYVARLENLTYRPQRTGQEQKVQGQRENRGAEDVLRQQNGNRNDITRLFVAMVRAAGIQARLMEVVDRGETVFDPAFMSMGQLDAEIAIVRLDDKDVYLDPGTAFCPYGILYWRYAGSQGIRQTTAGKTEIAETPQPDYLTAQTKRVTRLRLDERGQVDGVLAAGFLGQEALVRRLQALETDDVGRKKILEDEVKSWFPADAQIEMTKGPDWNAADAPLIAEFKVTSPMLVSAGKRVLLPASVLEYNRPRMFTHNERSHPVYFEYPSVAVDDVKITLPVDLEVEDLPANVSIKLDYAIYKADRRQEKNVIISSRSLAISAFSIGTTKYKEIKEFYDKAKEYDDQQILLKRATIATH